MSRGASRLRIEVGISQSLTQEMQQLSLILHSNEIFLLVEQMGFSLACLYQAKEYLVRHKQT